MAAQPEPIIIDFNPLKNTQIVDLLLAGIAELRDRLGTQMRTVPADYEEVSSVLFVLNQLLDDFHGAVDWDEE